MWLHGIMFWFVLSLKSLIAAAISQSSVALALVVPNRGRGTPHLVPRVCLRMIPLLPAEEVGVFLPRVLCVSYLQ